VNPATIAALTSGQFISSMRIVFTGTSFARPSMDSLYVTSSFFAEKFFHFSCRHDKQSSRQVTLRADRDRPI
jgi:hypothetical protein